MRFLQVTDFHLTDPDRSASGAEHARMIAEGLQKAGRMYPDAEFCVITGDIADDGEAGVYVWLSQQMSHLPFPVIPMIGNHDDRAAFRQVFPGPQNFVQSFLDVGGTRCLFLDTHDQGKVSGFLCDERLRWIENAVAGAQGRPLILFLHHPPCDIGDPRFDPSRLANPEGLAHALRKANAVHLYFGHVHQIVSTSWNGIPATSLARPATSVPTLVSTILDGRVASALAGSLYEPDA